MAVVYELRAFVRELAMAIDRIDNDNNQHERESNNQARTDCGGTGASCFSRIIIGAGGGGVGGCR
jgi:hypothetical protein